MNIKTLTRATALWLAPLALGFVIAGPVSGAALSISGTPLFITISMPSNIMLTLDNSGSMQSAFVPDTLDDLTTLTVLVTIPSTFGFGTTNVLVGNPPTTSHPSSIATCTQIKNGVCKSGKYDYSCPLSTDVQSSPWTPSGSSSTPPSGDTCTRNTYGYSCPTGYSLSPSSPASGTSSTASGYTCTQTVATYSCPSGWTQVGGTGSSSTCTNYLSKSIQGETSPMFASAAYNPLAYDPSISYATPYDASGNALITRFKPVTLPDGTHIPGAYLNGFYPTNGYVDLSTSYKVTVSYDPSSSSQTTTSCNGTFTATTANGSITCVSNGSGTAAYYYKYVPSNTGCPTTNPTKDARCYTLTNVGASEQQNFANWYSFYRTRNLTTVSAADRAFYNLSTTFRVGWQDLLTTCASLPLSTTGTCKGWQSSPSYDNRIGIFAGTHRQDFFNWVTHLPASTDTPLRGALERVGAYYQSTGKDSPYAFTPHVTDSPEYVCRPDYAVLMTDGLWNDTSVSFSPGDADSTAYTLPDGTAFTGNMHPYSDGQSDTLADIAFYYWSHSLRSDLGTSSSLQYMPYSKSVAVVDSGNHTASLLPYWNPANDPASWPHMVTFTVGLGMTTTLTNPAWSGNTYAGGYAGLVTGNISWPAVSGSNGGSANNVYDLWHAAIDSRGQFFSADNPQDVATAFNDIVNRIQGRVGSSSAIAVNSTRLDSDTFVYQAQFNSGGWTGEVLAFPISPVDGSIGAQAWSASSLIPAPNSRSIFTWDETANSGAGGGISFLWSSLNSTEKTNLNTNLVGSNDSNGSLRVDYLRGDQSQEQTQGGNFRTRASILGDIVNSNPQFVGKQDFGSASLPGAEGASYQAFVTAKASRTPMLYVGANDGMMHGINANTGVEVFDYVPRGVYANLSALTDPDYTHQYYVDGSETSVDAYISGAWKTLMVGTTGAGAKEVFLMDVSSPGTFSASNILWDYDGTTASDADMGYTLGQGTIVRMHDGDWYVLFGNGYNSTNQHAVLYLYNIRTKAIKKFDTLIGSVASPNGMSAPTPVDYDGDRITDAIYVGDLQGNAWKIDVSSANNTQWGFTFHSAGNPAPLFTAKDGSGNVQPITDHMQVGLSSTGNVMVFFGTGTYFLTGDNTVGSNPPVQSFYGIIDDLGTATADQVVRSNLLQQFIVAETTVLGRAFRTTTAYSMTTGQQGWYVDLNFPTAQGERVVSDPVLDFTRIIFTTLIPQGNACQFGGTSWLMELDSTTGAELAASLDTNGDGQVNANDYVTVTYTDPKTGQSVTTSSAVGGEQSNVGIIKTPGIISNGNTDYLIASGSNGSTTEFKQKGASPDVRLSWQQLQ